MFNFLAIIANLLNFAIPIILLVLIVCLIISIFLRIKIRVTDTKERANKRIIKVVIWSIIVVGIWAYLGSLNSTFDGDPPIITEFKDSNLPIIITQTNTKFQLEPGQSATIKDLNATLKYTGYISGAWISEPTYKLYYNYSPYSEVNNNEFVVDKTSLGNYSIEFIVQNPIEYCKTITGSFGDECWNELARKTSDYNLCQNIKKESARIDCTNALAMNAYQKNLANNKNEDAKNLAREICNTEKSTGINFCNFIKKEPLLSQEECLILYQEDKIARDAIPYQDYGSCFTIAKSFNNNNWNDGACKIIEEYYIKQYCQMIPIVE